MFKRYSSLLTVAAVAVTVVVSVAGQTSAATPGTDSLFGNVTTTKYDKPNTDAYEIGTLFTPRVSGTISAMRFYRATKCDYGTVYGMLYRGDAFQPGAVKLGTTAAVNFRQTTTPIGWQTLKFATPLTVTAGTRYTITGRVPHNCIARIDGSFTSARTIGNFDTPARATVWRKDRTGTVGSDTASYLTDFVFAAASPTTVTDVRAFGAVGDGVTDDADAIQRALYAMKAGDTLVFPAGYTFRHTAVSTNVNPWVPGRVLTVVTPNVRITGGGTLLATAPAISEFYLHADNAAKSRYMAIPDGTKITLKADGDFDFPNGTVLVKSFKIGGKFVETRLFMRHDDGTWAGYSYEWNDAQTDATLLQAGKVKAVGSQNWIYPSRGECLSCHTAAAGHSLGLELAQLNHEYVYTSTVRKSNQVKTLEKIGLFNGAVPTLPSYLVRPSGMTGTAEQKARSYLH